MYFSFIFLLAEFLKTETYIDYIYASVLIEFREKNMGRKTNLKKNVSKMFYFNFIKTEAL